MINSSWNISGDAAQYATHKKAEAIDSTKPAKGKRPGAGAASQGQYGGTVVGKATGKATQYSGV